MRRADVGSLKRGFAVQTFGVLETPKVSEKGLAGQTFGVFAMLRKDPKGLERSANPLCEAIR